MASVPKGTLKEYAFSGKSRRVFCTQCKGNTSFQETGVGDRFSVTDASMDEDVSNSEELGLKRGWKESYWCQNYLGMMTAS